MKTRTPFIVILSLVLALTLPSVSKLTAECSAACERMDDAYSVLSSPVVMSGSALKQRSAAPPHRESAPAAPSGAATTLSAAAPERGRSPETLTQVPAIADEIPLSASYGSADAEASETPRQRSRTTGTKRMLPPARRIALIS